MTVIDQGNEIYLGLSTDTKPTSGIPTGARFVETDTGSVWTFTSMGWILGQTSTAVLPKATGYRGPYVQSGTNSGVGMYSAVVLANGTGVVQTTLQANATDGTCTQWGTGTNNTNGRAGWFGAFSIMRKNNPIVSFRYRQTSIPTSGQAIMYIGLQNVGQPAAGTSMTNTFLNTKSGVLFGYRNTDTTYMIMSNNAQTTATYTTAGTPSSSAIDTNAHTLTIQITDSPAQINWWYDGTQMTSITDTVNSVPASTTALTPMLCMEANTATAFTIFERYSQVIYDVL